MRLDLRSQVIIEPAPSFTLTTLVGYSRTIRERTSTCIRYRRSPEQTARRNYGLEIQLVDERGCLKCVTGPLPAHVVSRQPVLEGRLIALAP